MVPLRFALGVTLICLLAAVPRVRADAPAYAQAPPGGDEVFFYPLRSGESLNDVARIFRVPAQELAALNRIADPNRLQVGQTLRVPNAFAREVEQLRADREQLTGQKNRAEQDAQERTRYAASLETQLRQAQSEKDSVARELTTMERWRKTAAVALALFLVALAWAFKTLLERAKLARKQLSLVAENAALAAAKEKYRQAAAQLELRYQSLYRGKGDPPKVTVADGIAKLRTAFGEGSATIEDQLALIRSEREKQQNLVEAEEKGRAWLLHPLRELLGRHRLKYHTP
ncbi:MAG TPA: LysM peptidoglycan-binding domain-containing protein [Candidatus Binatia bacterium]|nr:LysM peptidoglycan-binding domain-containing protein [Candidatus Binatia bacterium]